MTRAASRTVAVVVDGHRLAAQEVADPGLEDGAAVRRQLERVDRAAHPARRWASKNASTCGWSAHSRRKSVGGQEQGEAVLDRRDVERRRVAPGEGDRAEARSGATAVDEAALGVVDLGGTGAQDVQVVVVVAPGDERGAASEVLDGHPRREPVEHRRRKGVERLVLREELPDLGELDVEGHGPIVAVRRRRRARGVGPAGAWRARRAAIVRRAEHRRTSQSPARSVRLLE